MRGKVEMTDKVENEVEIEVEANVEQVEDKSTKQSDDREGWMSPEEAKRTREALAKANKEAQTRREKLREYEELGVDLEAAKQLLQEKQEYELEKAKEEKNFTDYTEKLKNSYKGELERYQSQIAEKEEAVGKYKSQLEQMLVDNEALRVLSDLKCEANELIMPHLQKEVKVVEDENGRMRTVLVDEYGDIREKDGKPVTIEDRLKEMRDHPVFGRAFAAPKVSGSGSNVNGDAVSGNKPPKVYKNELTESQRNEYIKKWGTEAFIANPRKR
jgi:hypothetical protein